MTTVALLATTVCCMSTEAPARRDLLKFASSRGLRAASVTGTSATFVRNGDTVVFHTNSRKLQFNKVLVWLNGPVSVTKGKWTITSPDAAGVLTPLLAPVGAPAAGDQAVVVLDPGHGGRSKGAVAGNKVQEKKLVLDIARRAAKKLRAAGVKTKLTRKRDRTLDLDARVSRARKWNASVFVSVHANYAGNRNASGIETYVPASPGFPSTAGGPGDMRASPANRHDPANMLLGFSVHQAMLKMTGAGDRGVRRARFKVISDAPCPAILLECGFLSNRREESRLLEHGYRDVLAEGIARGILRYLGDPGSGVDTRD